MQQIERSSQVYRSLNDKPYESTHLCFETVIDHPVAKVWPHALNIGGWMTDFRLETIAGQACCVGHFERVLPPDLGPEVPLPHYHLYGISKVIPFKLIALEAFPEHGGSYGKTRSWIIFDTILLVDLGARTHLILLMIGASLGRAEQPEPDQSAIAHERIHRYFDNLKMLLSTSGDLADRTPARVE